MYSCKYILCIFIGPMFSCNCNLLVLQTLLLVTFVAKAILVLLNTRLTLDSLERLLRLKGRHWQSYHGKCDIQWQHTGLLLYAMYYCIINVTKQSPFSVWRNINKKRSDQKNSAFMVKENARAKPSSFHLRGKKKFQSLCFCQASSTVSPILMMKLLNNYNWWNHKFFTVKIYYSS